MSTGVRDLHLDTLEGRHSLVHHSELSSYFTCGRQASGRGSINLYSQEFRDSFIYIQSHPDFSLQVQWRRSSSHQRMNSWSFFCNTDFFNQLILFILHSSLSAITEMDWHCLARLLRWFSLTFCPCWLQTTILLISTSWVARIKGVSHHTRASVSLILMFSCHYTVVVNPINMFD
jgi:hypothetical protein